MKVLSQELSPSIGITISKKLKIWEFGGGGAGGGGGMGEKAEKKTQGCWTLILWLRELRHTYTTSGWNRGEKAINKEVIHKEESS